MSKHKQKPTETKIIHASVGVPLGQNAVLAMFEYQSHLSLARSMGMPAWAFVLNYFGLELPLTPASTADGIVADINKAYAEMAAVYANTPAPAYAKVYEHSALPGDHISKAAEDAVEQGQALGNKYYGGTVELIAATRHKFSFNGATVDFNPWAKNEAVRVVDATRVAMDAAREAYHASDKYKARQAADEAERTALQAKVPVLMEHLPATLKRPIAELMEWVVDFATCHDRTGVTTDPEAVVAAFTAEGYAVGAYVGEEYKETLETDTEAAGRYIIGQFLHILPKRIGMPNAMWYFADQFRERVTAQAA